MIKRINFNDIRGIDYIGSNDFTITVETESGYQFIQDVLNMPKFKNDNRYAEIILDKNDNPVNITRVMKLGMKTNHFAQIKVYEQVLKEAIGGTYILAKLNEGNEIMFYSYSIEPFTLNSSTDEYFDIQSVNLHVVQTEVFSLSALDIAAFGEKKLYYKILKLVLDSKIYGIEYVAKNIDTLIYTNESDYMNTLLQCASGKHVHTLNGGICISNNKNCMLGEIVIVNDILYNMIDEREVYLTASIDMENKLLSILYTVDKARYVEDIDVILECECNSIARKILERYIDACICKARLI